MAKAPIKKKDISKQRLISVLQGLAASYPTIEVKVNKKVVTVEYDGHEIMVSDGRSVNEIRVSEIIDI